MSQIRAFQYSGDLPWNCLDPAKLGPVINSFTQEFDNYLGPWMSQWFENFNFIYGNHDIQWSRRHGFAVETDILRRSNNAINTRSKTNVSRTVAESLSSLIFGSAPDWDVFAADESSTQGRRFRKIADSILDCYYERLCMEKELRALTNNIVAYSMGAAKVDWSISSGSMMKIPRLVEADVPIFGEYPQSTALGVIDTIMQEQGDTGEPRTERKLIQEKDQYGQPIVDNKWSGDVRLTILTPFEYRRELNPNGAHKAKWHQHIRVIDFDEFLDEYGMMEGRTAYYDRVRPGIMHSGVSSFALRQFMRMNYVIPTTADGKRYNSSRLKHDWQRNKVVVIEHYDRPHPAKFPEGRLTVVVNGFVTNITKPQYSTNKVGGWHPFVECSWLNFQPSAIGSGPMNDITAKNRELDKLDSLIDTSSARNLGSMILVKSGSGLDAQRMRGEPGVIEEVNDLNCVTYLRDPVPVPPIIPQLREMKKNDIYEISGAQDAIRGDRSKGISSGYGQKIIEEREQKRLTPVRRELERSTAEIGQKILACLKQCASSLGPDTYGFLKRSAKGQFDEADIEAFLQAPMEDGVDISVRSGSMVAKSEATKQQDLIDLITQTSAGERLKDAQVLDNVLKAFGVEALRDGSAIHRDRASRENELFTDLGRMGPDTSGVQIPLVCDADDHEIHISSHELDMVEQFDHICQDEFQLTLRLFHIDMHKVKQREKMGELPAGTSYQFGQIYKQATEMPARDLGQVLNLKQQADQFKTQTEGQAAQANAQPGGKPNAPAEQTQGGQQAQNRDQQAQAQVGAEMGG